MSFWSIIILWCLIMILVSFAVISGVWLINIFGGKMKVKLFTKNNCAQCKMTKRYLDEYGIKYQEINIEENSKAREYLLSINVTSAPFIETDSSSWVGFRPDKLKELLECCRF